MMPPAGLYLFDSQGYSLFSPAPGLPCYRFDKAPNSTVALLAFHLYFLIHIYSCYFLSRYLRTYNSLLKGVSIAFEQFRDKFLIAK